MHTNLQFKSAFLSQLTAFLLQQSSNICKLSVTLNYEYVPVEFYKHKHATEATDGSVGNIYDRRNYTWITEPQTEILFTFQTPVSTLVVHNYCIIILIVYGLKYINTTINYCIHKMNKY